jgi:thiol-disulfide isomerase/thioredoxin
MNRTLILLSLLTIFVMPLFGQSDSNPPKHTVIQGRLLNCFSDQLLLVFNDENGNRIHETTDIDADGNFRLECTNIKGPILATIENKDFYTDIFLAPGYNLIIKADCEVKSVPTKIVSIEGYGSAANKYISIKDSINRIYPENWLKLKPDGIIALANKNKLFSDSVAHIVFNKKPAPDEYFELFRKIVQLNSLFGKLDMLTYLIIRDTTLSYQQSIDLINKNFDVSILKDINNQKYLISDSYQYFMKVGYYDYLRALSQKKNHSKVNMKTFWVDCLKIIDANYSGKIKQLTLYYVLLNTIHNCRSFEEINSYRAAFPQYIAVILIPAQRNELNALLTSKTNEFFKIAIGKPAPSFTAIDSLGKQHSLTDFKGEVVLIDLWASWCGPCREEAPYLAKVIKKYKADNRIKFISIAVMDKIDNWKKALIADKPIGLQLFDKDGLVQNGYVANSIPKFVLIDKQGNIVNFDSPMPSEPVELEKILDAEISK